MWKRKIIETTDLTFLGSRKGFLCLLVAEIIQGLFIYHSSMKDI